MMDEALTLVIAIIITAVVVVAIIVVESKEGAICLESGGLYINNVCLELRDAEGRTLTVSIKESVQ